MIDFERSKSGIFIPKRIGLLKKNTSRVVYLASAVKLSAFGKLLMVFIQLATVLILWKTYQDTVIPSRQKELLSEQVAQLELEQGRRAQEVVMAKQRVQVLDAELAIRRSDLQQLSAERERLLVEATSAQASAERARLSEASASASAIAAKSGLEASQWSIYYQSAAAIVALPQMIMIRKLGELERAGIGADDGKEAFHAYIEGIERIWPDMDMDAQMITYEIRQDESNFYPRWMVEEFATYFDKEARGMACQKPDFSAIREDVNNRFDVAAQAAIAKVRADQQERQRGVDEALARGVKISYVNNVDDYEVRVSISNSMFEIVRGIKSGLEASIEDCNDKYKPVGDRFFEGKGVSQPTIPERVYNEFSR